MLKSKLHQGFWRPGVHDLLIVLIGLTLAVLQMDNFADDPGVGWHLKSGQMMLRNFSPPSIDPFLASPFKRPWIHDQWLSDLIIAFFFQSGWPAVYGALLFLYLSTFLYLLYRIVRFESGAPLASSLAVVVAFKMAELHFILRPVLFSFLLFVIQYGRCATICRNLGSKDTALKDWLPKEVLKQAILFLLWANLHPSFFLGLFLLGLSLIGAAVARWRQVQPMRPLLFTAGCLLGAGLLASLLNPYGYQLHRSIIELGGSPYFMNLNEEWRAPSPLKFEMVLLEIVLLLVLLASKLKAPLRIFPLLCMLSFAVLSFKSVRFLPYFAIVAGVPLAVSISALLNLEARGGNDLLSRMSPAMLRLREWELKSAGGTLGLACMLAILLADHLSGANRLFGGMTLGPSAQSYPYGAVAYLDSKERDVSSVRVLSTPDWGGFMTLVGRGRIRATIDDRNGLLGEEFYREYFAAFQPGADWRPLAAKLSANFILWPAKSTLNDRFKMSAALDMVFCDDVGCLYRIRNTGIR
jgi:hypothetical protein